MQRTFRALLTVFLIFLFLLQLSDFLNQMRNYAEIQYPHVYKKRWQKDKSVILMKALPLYPYEELKKSTQKKAQ